MSNTFTCSDCGETITNTRSHVTGYGTIGKDTVCFSCCGMRDKEYMQKNGKITLYLSTDSKNRPTKISNWPGTLNFRATAFSFGRHNIARTRIDVWFVFDGYWWHGVQYGENTQLCHCKQTKERY